MVDLDGLPEEEAEQLEADGPGATVALGLGVGAADTQLYALEILTAAARKKKEFSERTLFSILMGVAAVAFIVVNFVIMGGLAESAGLASKSMLNTKKRIESSNTSATELLEQVRLETLLYQDLESRYAVSHGTDSLLNYLEHSLPESLWVESFSVSLSDGKEFGHDGRRIPVFEIAGRAEDDVRAASQAFGGFTGGMSALLADGDRDMQASSTPTGKNFEWSMRTQLMNEPKPEGDAEEELQ
jgi:hypothetical protein